MRQPYSGVLLFTIALAGCGSKPPAAEGPRPLAFPLERTAARMERGAYLASNVVGCLDCHSESLWKEPDAPPKPGMAGGGQIFPLEGLPGKAVASNISSDKETGAGNWADEDFYKAMTQGIGKDGRTLFPLMPYMHLRELSQEDLASIIVYVRSLPAIHNALPKTELIGPVKQSLKPLPPPAPGAPAPDLADLGKRGAYLANAAGCGDCHTPTNPQGMPLPGLDFGGGFVLKGPWGEVASANLTPDPSGIPYYDEAMFLKAMRTGKLSARRLNVIMPVRYYRNMTEQDLRALYAWVRTLKPVSHRVDNTEKPTPCKLCGQRHGLGEMNKAAPQR